jgi:periplasmic protein TonB
MLKGFVWSLFFHLLFLVSLFVTTGESRKDFVPITVLLAGDPPGEPGGNGQTASSQPKRSKTRKVKRNPGSSGHRAAEAGTASEPEQSFSASDINQKATVADSDTGVGILRSLSREAGLTGGEATGAGQGSVGEGRNAGGGSDGGRAGIGSGRGDGSGPGRANGNDGNASYLSANFGYIRDRILKGLSYPAQARRMGWKGRVTISFIISDSGCAENIKVVESSGYQTLDAHAVKTIKSCQPFPRPPMRVEVVIPIVYRIG